jgi:hypothetical protein
LEVTSVSASVRFSGAIGPSRFKTVELSAEATVQGDEDWQDAQSELYQELRKQVSYLWLQGQKALEGAEKAVEDIPGPDLTEPQPPVPDHYCLEHQTGFKRYQRGANTWYSHKTGDGAWCRETQLN